MQRKTNALGEVKEETGLDVEKPYPTDVVDKIDLDEKSKVR